MRLGTLNEYGKEGCYFIKIHSITTSVTISIRASKNAQKLWINHKMSWSIRLIPIRHLVQLSQNPPYFKWNSILAVDNISSSFRPFSSTIPHRVRIWKVVLLHEKSPLKRSSP